MKRLAPILTVLGGLMLVGSLAGLWVSDFELWKSPTTTFTDPVGETLTATYRQNRLRYGVLFLHGLSADQTIMRSAMQEFAGRGFTVFAFDFSGHGGSSGALTFDNAQTDRLAKQVLAAKEEFKRLTGLADEQIILMGHSMGARVALQAAMMDSGRVAGIIMVGPSVNLVVNTQSEFFTGVSDADLEWIQQLGPDNPPVPILVMSGTWDDIFPLSASEALFAKISGSNRERVLVSNVFHNYEMFSPRILAKAKVWAWEQWGQSVEARAPIAARRIWFWLTGLAGMFLTLIGAERWLAMTRPMPPSELSVTVTRLNRFLWGKLLLWLGALPLSLGVITGYYFLVPLGVPVFILIYGGFIGAYGLLLFILYRLGKMPGAQGRLLLTEKPGFFKKPGFWPTVGLTLVALLLTALYSQTGLASVPPVGQRFLWLIILTPLTALGFWIGLHESQMLAQVAPGKTWPHWAATLIGLTPFFLLTGLYAALGSLSGFVGGVQGLITLALVLVFGALVQRVGQGAWLTAVAQAALLYWLVLPSSAMFAR